MSDTIKDGQTTPTLEIIPGKFYRTRDGLKARVLCTDVQSPKPVLALVLSEGSELVFSYENDGCLMQSRESCHWDLVAEWSEPLEVDWSKFAAWHNAVVWSPTRDRWLVASRIPTWDDKANAWTGAGGDGFDYVPPEHAPKWTGEAKDSLIVRPGCQPS